jgi:ABC-type multidrug transport system fused ATPase/permease subunit
MVDSTPIRPDSMSDKVEVLVAEHEPKSDIVETVIHVSAPSSVPSSEFDLTTRDQSREPVISLRGVGPVDVRIRDLSVSLAVPSKRKRLGDNNPENGSTQKVILNKVSADMSAGTLTAILGASGSGKVSIYKFKLSALC